MRISRINKKTKHALIIYNVFVLLLCFTTSIHAEGSPLEVINNLSNFIFALIRGAGMIMLGFGVVQVGLSFKSQDPSQRANGVLTLMGGIIITFSKEILNIIIGG